MIKMKWKKILKEKWTDKEFDWQPEVDDEIYDEKGQKIEGMDCLNCAALAVMPPGKLRLKAHIKGGGERYKSRGKLQCDKCGWEWTSTKGGDPIPQKFKQIS